MPTLTEQYSFSFSGLTFGGAGSPYQILSVDGLEGLPAIRNQDDNRGYADGMFSGNDFLSGRTISIILNIFGSGATSAQENFNTFQRYILFQRSGTTNLYFKLPDSPVSEQFVKARVRGLQSSIDPNYTYGYIVAQVTFFCPDPNIYNSNTQTATLAYTPPTGRIYNRVYNLEYGGGSYIITTTVTNTGWATTYPIITINGPIDNPYIGNSTESAALYFNCTLSSSDSLVIDTYNKLITINGNPARNTLISGSSEWFALPPGNNEYYLSGTVGSTVVGVTQATVEWQSAYI